MFVQQLPILELQYSDASGSKGTVLMRAPLGTTYSDMDVSAMALASIIAPVTGCVLIRQRIIFKAVSTPRPETTGSSPIARRGVFYFHDETDAYQALIEVPGLIDSVLVSEGPATGVLIELTNTDVIELVTQSLALPLTDPFGNEMTDIVIAYLQSRVK